MGFLKSKPTMDDLEEEKDRVVIEEEILTHKAEMAEKEAVISELKKKYGKGWAKMLGVNKLTDLSTLRSFLVSAKKGLESKVTREGDTPLTKLFNFKGITKA